MLSRWYESRNDTDLQKYESIQIRINLDFCKSVWISDLYCVIQRTYPTPY